MEKHIIRSIVVLICINTMDSIMSAIVKPTMIFYVTDLGGDKDDYGLMSSIVAVSSLIMISVYGRWVDTNGNKFVAPYMFSFFFGILASIMYFLAILVPKGRYAIWWLTVSRFIEGIGASGRNLSYIWVASAIPREKQRTTLTLLSSTKTLGMVVGPLANVLVAEIDTKIQIFGITIPVNSLNSIGLLMVFGESLLVVITLLLFYDPPPPKEKSKSKKARDSEVTTASTGKGFWHAIGHFDIFFPVFTALMLFSIFPLQIAFSPVAKYAGWDPTEISKVSSVGAILMSVSLVFSAFLSTTDLSDTAMISFGMGLFFVSGSASYIFWTDDPNFWKLGMPLFLLMFGYPYIGPANRSKFTKAIHEKPELDGLHGVLSGLINQAAAVSGIVGPTLVTSLILRKPEDIDASSNKHQLTMLAFYAPLCCVFVIAGLFYQDYFYKPINKSETTADDNDTISETTTLVSAHARASRVRASDACSINSQVNRRMSVEFMGIPNPLETKTEKELMDKLWQDKKEWDELEEIED